MSDRKEIVVRGATTPAVVVIAFLPVFFAVWYISSLVLGIFAGLVASALSYVAFVWLPEDERQKLLRARKFAKAVNTLEKIDVRISEIVDPILRMDLAEAHTIAEGLVRVLANEADHMGKVEESVPVILENMLTHIDRWLLDQSGERPLSRRDKDKLLGVLLNYDVLFLKYQREGLSSDRFLTSLYHTEATMQSFGINTEENNDQTDQL